MTEEIFEVTAWNLVESLIISVARPHRNRKGPMKVINASK
jgi:hypothetical protein